MESKKKYENFEDQPPVQAWNRIEEKLESHHMRRNLIRFRRLSYAAIAITIFCIGFIVEHKLSHSKDPALFSSNGDYKSIMMEELELEGQAIYDWQQIEQLKIAYARNGL